MAKRIYNYWYKVLSEDDATELFGINNNELFAITEERETLIETETHLLECIKNKTDIGLKTKIF